MMWRQKCWVTIGGRGTLRTLHCSLAFRALLLPNFILLRGAPPASLPPSLLFLFRANTPSGAELSCQRGGQVGSQAPVVWGKDEHKSLMTRAAGVRVSHDGDRLDSARSTIRYCQGKPGPPSTRPQPIVDCEFPPPRDTKTQGY